MLVEEKQAGIDVTQLNEGLRISRALRESILGVKGFVAQQNPDLILFTGHSSIISEDISLVSGITGPTTTTRTIESNKGDWYFGNSYPPLEGFLGDVDRDQKLVVIDEFISTGAKAVSITDALRDLGFKDPSFAAFVGRRPIRRAGIYMGSFDDELFNIMTHLAEVVSMAKSIDPKKSTSYQRGIASRKSNALRRSMMGIARGCLIDSAQLK